MSTRPSAPACALAAASIALSLAAAAPRAGTEGHGLDERERRALARLSPLPDPPADPTNAVADDPRAARLGQFLFFDPRLSIDGSTACATCHVPERGFSDGKPVAQALGVGTRRTPSVVNAAYHRWLFWDGRADSLWSQALEPLENPLEMGSNRLRIAHLVHGDAELSAAYEALFGALPPLEDAERFPADACPRPDDPDHAWARAWRAMEQGDRAAVNRVLTNLTKAIAAYERRLVRRDAPFDRYAAAVLAGEGEGLRALGPAARRGLSLFLGRARCTLCHNGPNLSDSEFHDTSSPTRDGREPDDPGRYEGARRLVESPFHAAGPYSDDTSSDAARRVERLRLSSDAWGAFKTPSLRNLGPGPFMHEGQFETLEQVLHFYSTLEGATARSHHQEQILIPLRLSDGEVSALLAFLGSLRGEPLPPELSSAPPSPLLESPEAGPGGG